MVAHLAYLRYVLAHKWWVFLAGIRVGAPLWRLVIHDWSKFTPAEWGPYVRQFFSPSGERRMVREPDGRYRIHTASDEFQLAWLHHQRNRHHWQAWISIEDGGELRPLPMPRSYVLEMVADWMGAGRAITGRWEAREWYDRKKGRMVLHPETCARVEALLNAKGEG